MKGKKINKKPKTPLEIDYKHNLFGDYKAKDLSFLHERSLDAQIKKVKELLSIDDNETEYFSQHITNAESLYAESILSTDTFSSGIRELDGLLTHKGFLSGDIIEICGLTQSGKSILINTILTNVLKEHRDLQIIYFDSKQDFQAQRFLDLLLAQGNKKEDALKILGQVSVVQTSNIFELVHALHKLFDPHRFCQGYKGDFDMNKVRIIVINTITFPFFHISSPYEVNKKISADLHKVIYQLAKHCGITFFIANLALHKYKISESDKGDDLSSVGSTKSIQNFIPLENVKAALDSYWAEMLDQRFVITAVNSRCDIFGYVEIPRQITLAESRYEKWNKSIIVKITDIGIV